MIERICVKVQDHLNSLRNSEMDVILEDVKSAENIIRDARNSKTVSRDAQRSVVVVVVSSRFIRALVVTLERQRVSGPGLPFPARCKIP